LEHGVRFSAFPTLSELRLHCGFLNQETSPNKYVLRSFAQGSKSDDRKGRFSINSPQ
jgi:hypothetical protein